MRRSKIYHKVSLALFELYELHMKLLKYCLQKIVNLTSDSATEIGKWFSVVYYAGRMATTWADIDKFTVQATGLTQTMSVQTAGASESASMVLDGYNDKSFVVEDADTEDCRSSSPEGLAIQTCEGKLRVRELKDRAEILDICLGLNLLLPPPRNSARLRLRLRPIRRRPARRNQNNRRTNGNNSNNNNRNSNNNNRNSNNNRNQRVSKKAESSDDDSIGHDDHHEDGHHHDDHHDDHDDGHH